MAKDNTPIVVKFWWTNAHNHIIFYGHSLTLQTLYIFPYIQILIIVVFVFVVFVAFRSLKQSEQSRIWVGLAKETAHQLGTPTSSLLGWIEYLREQPIDQMAVDEMQKDLAHLMKIVDRFSKIGSETPLTVESLNEVVGGSVMYFRKRIPRNVTVDYNGLATNTVKAKINVALFEWVVENLMKNALDALQGKGEINVTIGSDNKYAWVEVADTGKGIPKSKWKRIFEPGYTTKQRGWGLGLSLAKRIIEEYHNGKIFVKSSDLGLGTTFRIELPTVQVES
jgi:signal transduction histidine kinase